MCFVSLALSSLVLTLAWYYRKQISTTFAALAKQHGGYLGKEQAQELLSSVGMEGKEKHEAAELLWSEMRLSHDAHITEVLSPVYVVISIHVLHISQLE